MKRFSSFSWLCFSATLIATGACGCSSESVADGGDGDGAARGSGGEGQSFGTGGSHGTGGTFQGTGGLVPPGTGGDGVLATGGAAFGVGGNPVGSGGDGGATGGAPAGTGGAPDGTGGTLPRGDTPVERYGQLSVSSAHIVDQTSEPVALHGLGFGWDNWWPQFYNADVVSWLASDFCVDIVRPAMGIEPDGAYLQDSTASRARIEAVVDAAIAEGLYVIIDWHAHDLHEAEATTFFTAMAQKYGGTPNVLYEIFNEPEDDETWPQVKSYAENVIAAIRQHDPDNIVIVGSPEWDQRIDLVQADPITGDSNVVYSVHYYADTHGAWLRDRTQTAINAGIPVFVSESSGSKADGLGANNYPEWEAWFNFLDENDIGWINYAIADKEGETISILEPGASGMGDWDADSLTESGEYIRTKLRSSCP